MEPAFTAHLLARVILTVPVLGYGFLAARNDFNATHATNPLWTPHARFHVVWQMLSYSGLGIMVLALIWIPGRLERERLDLAALIGAIILGAFFLTAAVQKRFGGALHDVNGYQPFRPPMAPASWRWDLNMTGFSAFAALQVLGWAVI